VIRIGKQPTGNILQEIAMPKKHETTPSTERYDRIRDILHENNATLLSRYNSEVCEHKNRDRVERWLVGRTVVYVHILDDSIFIGSEVRDILEWQQTEEYIKKLALADEK
jgi:hypothetical protein